MRANVLLYSEFNHLGCHLDGVRFRRRSTIIDRNYLPENTRDGSGGAIVLWHVDDLSATLARLKELGAHENEPRTERGAGFSTASVIDPFGNILGLMYSPHYLQTLESGVK